MPQCSGAAGHDGVESQLSPATVSRRLSQGVHAHLLENGTARQFCALPPAGAAGELVGASGPGGADQHTPALWQNYQRLYVCSGHALQRASSRAQHLQHVQTHFAEAAARGGQVLLRDMRAGPRQAQLPHPPPEHGGDCADRPRGRARRTHRQLVPEQGAPALPPALSAPHAARHAARAQHAARHAARAQHAAPPGRRPAGSTPAGAMRVRFQAFIHSTGPPHRRTRPLLFGVEEKVRAAREQGELQLKRALHVPHESPWREY